jgi:hypothetical protein
LQATVISVQPNVTKQGKSGPYQVHIFTYQPDPVGNYGAKPPTTRDIFVENRNYPQVPIQVAALQAGQRVDLTFTPQAQNPRFKDLSNVQVIGAQAPAPPVQQPQPATYAQNPPPVQQPPVPQQPAPVAAPVVPVVDERQLSIQKQCALKAAVELVKGLLAKEKYYPVKVKKEILAKEVMFFADEFDAYLLGMREEFDPDQGIDELPDSPVH